MANKSKETMLKEMLQELDILHKRVDVVENYVRVLLAKEGGKCTK